MKASTDFRAELLGCEVEARRSRYLRAQLQLFHLPVVRTFDQFSFGFQVCTVVVRTEA
jgi:hypothetical protein